MEVTDPNTNQRLRWNSISDRQNAVAKSHNKEFAKRTRTRQPLHHGGHPQRARTTFQGAAGGGSYTGDLTVAVQGQDWTSESKWRADGQAALRMAGGKPPAVPFAPIISRRWCVLRLERTSSKSSARQKSTAPYQGKQK